MQLRLTLTNCINQLGGIFGANMHSFCLSLAMRLMLFNFFKEVEAEKRMLNHSRMQNQFISTGSLKALLNVVWVNFCVLATGASYLMLC